MDVGMDSFLWETEVVEGVLLDEFHQNELGNETDVVDTFYENLKYASTTPLFSPVP
jgi:hypothetical protein